MNVLDAIRGRVAGRYALLGFERAPMGNLLAAMAQVSVLGSSVVVIRLDLEEASRGNQFRASAEDGLNRFVLSLLERQPYGLRPVEVTLIRQWAESNRPRNNPIRDVERRPVQGGTELVFLPGDDLLAEAERLADELNLGWSWVSRLAQLLDAYRGTSDRTLIRDVQAAEGGGP